jgi:hypothetical protein
MCHLWSVDTASQELNLLYGPVGAACQKMHDKTQQQSTEVRPCSSTLGGYINQSCLGETFHLQQLHSIQIRMVRTSLSLRKTHLRLKCPTMRSHQSVAEDVPGSANRSMRSWASLDLLLCALSTELFLRILPVLYEESGAAPFPLHRFAHLLLFPTIRIRATCIGTLVWELRGHSSPFAYLINSQPSHQCHHIIPCTLAVNTTRMTTVTRCTSMHSHHHTLHPLQDRTVFAPNRLSLEFRLIKHQVPAVYGIALLLPSPSPPSLLLFPAHILPQRAPFLHPVGRGSCGD